jgi:hypothetical protein
MNELALVNGVPLRLEGLLTLREKFPQASLDTLYWVATAALSQSAQQEFGRALSEALAAQGLDAPERKTTLSDSDRAQLKAKIEASLRGARIVRNESLWASLLAEK